MMLGLHDLIAKSVGLCCFQPRMLQIRSEVLEAEKAVEAAAQLALPLQELMTEDGLLRSFRITLVVYFLS